MASYTLSLSRWHKVAERLSRTYTELTQGVRNTYNNTQISGYLGESQIVRMRDQGQCEANNLLRAFKLQDALIQIRQAIGEINAKTGVNRELAEYDALMRRHKFLESILTAQTSDMVGLDELPMIPNRIGSEDRFDRMRAGVKVKVMDSETEADLRIQTKALLVKAYALSDRISDLNREKLTLDLPEDIASASGL
jgi:hypothetical protein